MQLAVKNNAVSTLAQICLIGDDHVHITTPALMNAGAGTWSLHVEQTLTEGEGNEIMLVTGVPTGDSFPVTRAQEGTSAMEHPAGALVFDSITQGRLQEIMTKLESVVPVNGEICLTPKASSTGAEGTMFYDSDDDHVWVATSP
jgi:hypothetical protein